MTGLILMTSPLLVSTYYERSPLGSKTKRASVGNSTKTRPTVSKCVRLFPPVLRVHPQSRALIPASAIRMFPGTTSIFKAIK